METFRTFAERLRLKGYDEPSDVYVYDDLPLPLRRQIIHIWNSSMGYATRRRLSAYGSRRQTPIVERIWNTIYLDICRELGLLQLGNAHATGREQLDAYMQSSKAVKDLGTTLYIIQETFRGIVHYADDISAASKRSFGIWQSPEEAVAELNKRFLQHRVGYQYEEGYICRIDSSFLHAEVVRPAVALLLDSNFETAADEFLRAHEKFRNGDDVGAIDTALKSFESTLKMICDSLGWEYSARATVHPLIGICITNGLIPRFLDSHFAGLRSALEAGVPTIRNNLGGHGKGHDQVHVPAYMVSYMLHLTAASIVLVVEAYRDRQASAGLTQSSVGIGSTSERVAP